MQNFTHIKYQQIDKYKQTIYALRASGKNISRKEFWTMSNNKIIFLRNKVLENEKLTEYDIAAYIGLRDIYTKDLGELLITVDTISCKLYGDYFTKVKRNTKENLRKSIIRLGELGIINIIKDYGKGNYLIDMESLFFVPSANDTFTTIEEKEVRNLLNIDDNIKLLRYFVMIIRTVNAKYRVGFTPIDDLAKLAGISSKSVSTYNKILEDNKLIYIYHHDMIYSTGNDTISSLPNHYGRYKDKSKIKSYAEEYEEKQKNAMSDIKRKKKKAKEKKPKQQEESRTGININNNK